MICGLLAPFASAVAAIVSHPLGAAWWISPVIVLGGVLAALVLFTAARYMLTAQSPSSA